MRELPGRLVLLGHPVAHSLSPVFQNAALRQAGIPLVYEALDVAPESIASTLDNARRNNWAGNVTVPYKEMVFGACDELSPEAARAGAVNAFLARDGSLRGHNTDVAGFRSAVIELLGRVPSSTLFGVIGAGGAAAAVLAGIEGWTGCRALIANRDGKRAHDLAGRFGSIASVSDTASVAGEADILVNATSLGLSDADPLPVDLHRVRPRCAVLDLVYSPRETRLVREARSAGLRASDGLTMLFGQGLHAFGWWFNEAADPVVMWQALEAMRAPQSGSSPSH